MMNTESFRQQAAERARFYYGAEVQIEDSMRHEEVAIDGGAPRTFPYYECRWKANGQRHVVLLKPILRRVVRPGLWPLISDREGYEVDNDAMMRELRRLVQSTLPPASSALASGDDGSPSRKAHGQMNKTDPSRSDSQNI